MNIILKLHLQQFNNMTYEQIILDEVKKDPVAKWAVEMYESEGFSIKIDNFTDTIDNITYVRVLIYPPNDTNVWMASTASSLQDIISIFKYQLDIFRP